MSKEESNSIGEAFRELPDLVGSLFCGGGSVRRRHRAHSDGHIRGGQNQSSLRQFVEDIEKPVAQGDPEAWEAHPWAVAFDAGDAPMTRVRTASSDFDTDDDDDFADLPAMVRASLSSPPGAPRRPRLTPSLPRAPRWNRPCENTPTGDTSRPRP